MKEWNYDLTTKEQRSLKKRYLFWLYKAVKEPLDKIDRKFTQLEIDKKLLKELNSVKAPQDKSGWDKLIGELRVYIDNKEKDAISLKYYDQQKNLKIDYLFLKAKLRAIEQLILDEFGKKQLQSMKLLYEEEMIKRIIQERQPHK